MSDARSRLARLGLPCCVGLVALSPLASCTRTTVSDPIDLSALPAGTDGELEFWHTLPGRSAVTNNEGLHGLLLLIDGQDAATTYEERTDLLKQRGWMDTDFSEPADMAMQRGTLAKALTGPLTPVEWTDEDEEAEDRRAAGGGGPRIPGKAQRLETSTGQRDQVLLQRIDAEDELDLVIRGFSAGFLAAFRVDEELAVALEKARGALEMREGGVIEIAQHGGGRGMIHRQVVVRASPLRRLIRVALHAGVLADVGEIRARRAGVDGRDLHLPGRRGRRRRRLRIARSAAAA